jgi:hypothetical protein
MKTSIYTSLFNYSIDKFDLLGSFKNWSKYADEIVIATFEDQVKEVAHEAGMAYFNLNKIDLKIQTVSCPDTSLDDPLFDGKLKNAALQACSNEFVIQQDMDERIGGETEQWNYLISYLSNLKPPYSVMIPVIDLYKDYNHYKSIGGKWYLHFKEGSSRGPVNFAKREDGSLDINKSDSCELIDENGNLIPYLVDSRFSQPFVNKEAESLDISMPHVIHLGYLDLTKRAEHNKFRKKCWEAMDGKAVEVATTIEALEKENDCFIHGLGSRWWE